MNPGSFKGHERHLPAVFLFIQSIANGLTFSQLQPAVLAVSAA